LKCILNSESTHINAFVKDCAYNPEMLNLTYKLKKSIYLYSFLIKIRCFKFLIISDFLRFVQLPILCLDKNISEDEKILYDIAKFNTSV